MGRHDGALGHTSLPHSYCPLLGSSMPPVGLEGPWGEEVVGDGLWGVHLPAGCRKGEGQGDPSRVYTRSPFRVSTPLCHAGKALLEWMQLIMAKLSFHQYNLFQACLTSSQQCNCIYMGAFASTALLGRDHISLHPWLTVLCWQKFAV